MLKELTKEEIISEVENRKKSVQTGDIVFVAIFIGLLYFRNEMEENTFVWLAGFNFVFYFGFLFYIDRCPKCGKLLSRYPIYCKKCGSQLKKFEDEVNENEIDNTPLG